MDHCKDINAWLFLFLTFKRAITYTHTEQLCEETLDFIQSSSCNTDAMFGKVYLRKKKTKKNKQTSFQSWWCLEMCLYVEQTLCRNLLIMSVLSNIPHCSCFLCSRVFRTIKLIKFLCFVTTVQYFLLNETVHLNQASWLCRGLLFPLNHQMLRAVLLQLSWAQGWLNG